MQLVNHFFFSLRWSASVHFGVCSECVGNECVMIFWSMVSVLGLGSFSPDAIYLNRKIDCYIFSISLISRFLLMVGAGILRIFVVYRYRWWER